MSLITCSECRTPVSTAAKVCPNCGASARVLRRGNKVPMGWKMKALIGFVGFFAVTNFLIFQFAPPPPPPIVAVKTPAEKAKAHRDTLAFLAVAAIKRSLRDPDSVQFESVNANDAGNVICVEYRARNGFGGMNKEFAVYVDGVPSQRPAIWNRHCVGQSLHDVTGVASISDMADHGT